MRVFLCANIGQGYIVYFYVSGIWDKKTSQFNKELYQRKNTYERVRPDIMYSFFYACRNMPLYVWAFIRDPPLSSSFQKLIRMENK